MERVRLLAVLPAVIAGALLVAPEPKLPSGLDLQGALIRASEIVARGRGTDEPSAPRPPIRRISQSGHDYGECSGRISAVLLDPEPCDGLWQRRRNPLQAIRE